MLEKILDYCGITYFKHRKELANNLRKLEKFEKYGDLELNINQIKMWTNTGFASLCAEKLATLENRQYLAVRMAQSLVSFANHNGEKSEKEIPIHKYRLNKMFDEEILKTYDMYKDDLDNIFPVMGNTIFKYPASDKCIEFAKIFQKYRHEDYEPFIRILYYADVEQLEHIDTNELLSEKGFEEAKKNFRKVALQGYSTIRFCIMDKEIQKRITYKEMDPVANAYNAVRKIHQERDYQHTLEIRGAFFREMQRALDQGKTVDERILLFRQYGKEVLEKMKNSASELMLVG